MTEEWRAIKGYEGKYEVSNLGRVRSIDRIDTIGRSVKGRILKAGLDGKGNYLHVNLVPGGTKNVHRIVAETFVDNPDNLPEVNHIDENKTNNRAENLEWCTRKYNNNYGNKFYASKGESNSQNRLTTEEVIAIRKMYCKGESGRQLRDVAKAFGISETHAFNIIRGKRWGWL